MASKQSRRHKARSRTIETLEQRQVMSADPISAGFDGRIEHHVTDDLLDEPPAMVQHGNRDADFWLDPWSERDVDSLLGDVEKTLASAHNSTGLTQARNDYGFIGTGQTVVVIDSGIAWDHFALGGGFGPNYRVVGGWDFTEENDAVPYDDGTAGSHGTHVAGIVGADRDGTKDDGVAPGVDLVALRVFNDAGDGYFSWTEKALRWVHENRNAFENPITAVNLSLGAAWNSTSLPAWSTLEEELAQLKEDGIFISVSAGNSFAKYNAPGLGYPAASPHVVPVMAVRDNGVFANFSQRHPNAIAAPGQGIVSTVPDYVGNQNGINDDFASFSGTSMAAPYVAGASVLIREAMEFVGYTNITQDTIFSHMMSTATTFFDTATNLDYKRLDLGNALNTLMPTDEYGSTVAMAYNLGTLSGDSEISGLIGTLSDVDYFQFTASANGTVSFTADTTHNLAPVWTATGGTVSGDRGQTYTFQVTAGQSYNIGLSTSNGIGYYDLSIDVSSAFTFVDWGTITQSQRNDVAAQGESWYRVQASQAGYFTAAASFAGSGGSVNLAWFDANLQQVATGTSSANSARAERIVNAGDVLYLRVTGTNSDIDFQLTNLVSVTGTTAVISGTSAADVFTFATGSSQHVVSVNGATYQFSTSSVSKIDFIGGDGNDSISMTGKASNEVATLRAGEGTLAGSGYTATVAGVENITLLESGGTDRVELYDTSGDDVLLAWSTHVLMSGTGYSNYVRGYDIVNAYASSGYDQTIFYDSAGDDVFTARPDDALLTGAGYSNRANRFDNVQVYGSTGNDQATFYDSAGDDLYRGWSNQALMMGSGYFNYVSNFDTTYAYATTGQDRAEMFDSAGDDGFLAWSTHIVMFGTGFYNYAKGFDAVVGNASSGYDQAIFYDSAGDDAFIARPQEALLAGSGYSNQANRFDNVQVYGSTGYDEAHFYDSAGDDLYRGWSDQALLMGDGFFNYVCNFDRTFAYGSTGHDRADLFDSAGDDGFLAWSTHAVMVGTNFYNYAKGFGVVSGNASSGYDQAILYDSAGDDVYTARPEESLLTGAGFSNRASRFDNVQVYGSTGLDRAYFYDSAGDDLYRGWCSEALMMGSGYFNYVSNFDQTYACASTGYDRADLFDSANDDFLFVRGRGAYIESTNSYNDALDFDNVAAYMSDGDDELGIEATDFVFQLFGVN